MNRLSLNVIRQLRKEVFVIQSLDRRCLNLCITRAFRDNDHDALSKICADYKYNSGLLRPSSESAQRDRLSVFHQSISQAVTVDFNQEGLESLRLLSSASGKPRSPAFGPLPQNYSRLNIRPPSRIGTRSDNGVCYSDISQISGRCGIFQGTCLLMGTLHQSSNCNLLIHQSAITARL